tara:strand:- start:61 stop:1386 length:1326 start_codon:yes stop_codon:yes gene_type:complete
MLYSANNAKLKVNDVEIIASNAELSLSTNLDPLYVASSRSSDNFVASNGIGGQLNFNYFLTGTDYFKSFITGQGETEADTTVISGNFGGLNFDSGYLTSYSVNFSPNSPAVASASVKFFDELKGEFVPTSSAPPSPPSWSPNSGIEVLNFSNASISSEFGVDVVDNFVAGAFNYNADVSAAYLMNETKPSRVSFGVKTVNMNFEVDNPTGRLPISGTNAKIEVGLSKFNNENIVMGKWWNRVLPSNYEQAFSTSSNGDVSAETAKNGTDPEDYAIADSSAFLLNEGEVFAMSFDLNLIAGTAPKLQLINEVGSLTSEKKGWSTSQQAANGSNSFSFTAAPQQNSTVIGSGVLGTFQVYNNSPAEWELTNFKVTRTTTKPSETFVCSGVMQGRNIASAAGDYIKQTINIIQGKSDVVDIKVSYLIAGVDGAGGTEEINVNLV